MLTIRLFNAHLTSGGTGPGLVSVPQPRPRHWSMPVMPSW